MKKILLPTLALLMPFVAPQAFCQRILTTIGVDGQPANPIGLVINPTTNHIYVLNSTLNTVTVVDGNLNQVVTNISLGMVPLSAAVNPTTNMVYVSAYADTSAFLVVIDGSSNIVSATIPVSYISWIAVNPTTNLIYFTDTGCGNYIECVSVLDGTTNEIVNSFGTQGGIEAMTVDPVRNRIYLATNLTGSQLAVIDGYTGKFEPFNVPGLCDVFSIHVDSTLNRIYMPDDVCGGMYVISGINYTVLTHILPEEYYNGPIGLNPVNHQVAYFGGFPFFLSFISGRTDQVVANLSFPTGGGGPMTIAANNDNRYYVDFYKSGEIAVVEGPVNH